jgi:hypothetical protein
MVSTLRQAAAACNAHSRTATRTHLEGAGQGEAAASKDEGHDGGRHHHPHARRSLALPTTGLPLLLGGLWRLLLLLLAPFLSTGQPRSLSALLLLLRLLLRLLQMGQR